MNKKLKIGIIAVWFIFLNYLNRGTLKYKPLLSSSFIQKEIAQGKNHKKIP